MGVSLVVTRFRGANLTPWQPTRRSFGASARRRDNRLRIRAWVRTALPWLSLCAAPVASVERRKSLGHGTTVLTKGEFNLPPEAGAPAACGVTKTVGACLSVTDAGCGRQQANQTTRHQTEPAQHAAALTRLPLDGTKPKATRELSRVAFGTNCRICSGSVHLLETLLNSDACGLVLFLGRGWIFSGRSCTKPAGMPRASYFQARTRG